MRSRYGSAWHGGPLVLARSFVSGHTCGGWFGRTWAATLDQRLEMDSKGIVRRRRRDAAVEHTDFAGNTTRQTHFGLPATRTEPDGTRYAFTYTEPEWAATSTGARTSTGSDSSYPTSPRCSATAAAGGSTSARSRRRQRHP
ncbi:DUF6531 domain-containing protein [Streptomyces sp. NPDC051366]|uniref:DUF6531 domain-containing protein n=1 Tax=Streptomyces sp. NPDC051366 TaxID=3365652 RepID=UPI00378A353B